MEIDLERLEQLLDLLASKRVYHAKLGDWELHIGQPMPVAEEPYVPSARVEEKEPGIPAIYYNKHLGLR